MINSKGEVIYTSAEIAYEVGISPATVNAIGRRLYGSGRIPHWTLTDAQRIMEYIRSISVEEDAKRLAALHDACLKVFDGKLPDDDSELRKRVNNDIRGVTQMMCCEGYKMFHGVVTVTPASESGVEPFDMTGTWLYKPDTKYWYCKPDNGGMTCSLAPKILSDFREV